MEFDGNSVDGGCADNAKNVDEVATNCKLCAVGVILFWAVVYTDAGVGGVAAAIGRDLIALDEDNCVGAFADARDALQQTGKFLLVYNLPQSSLYLGSMRRCHISMSWPVDLSRTAWNMLVGNCWRAVLRGVMTLPVTSPYVLMQASIASCVMVRIWALLQVLQDGPSLGAGVASTMPRSAIC